MIILKQSSRYQKEHEKFVRHNPQRGEALIKTLRMLSSNPSHPSLRLEKLGGTDVWSARLDRKNRLFFRWEGSTLRLLDIGPHDKYKEYKRL